MGPSGSIDKILEGLGKQNGGPSSAGSKADGPGIKPGPGPGPETSKGKSGPGPRLNPSATGTGTGTGPGTGSAGTKPGTGSGPGPETPKRRNQGNPKEIILEADPEPEKKSKKKGTPDPALKLAAPAPGAQAPGPDLDLKKAIASTLETVFNGLAARLGPVWQVTPDEINNISGPAARIADRIGFSESAGKYGDYIALTVAAGLVVVPRIMIMGQMKKEINKRNGQNTEATINNDVGPVRPVPAPVNPSVRFGAIPAIY